MSSWLVDVTYCFVELKHTLVYSSYVYAYPLCNTMLQPAIANTALPAPILFHPLKHHLGYINEFVQKYNPAQLPALAQNLQSIGTSQLDFYTGTLQPIAIASEITDYLRQQNLLQPDAYLTYLSEHSHHYRIVNLSDGTAWVLRWGLIAERYVHIHPARYAAQTIRVKAVTLKTAIAATIAARQLSKPISLQFVNHVRAQWLYLPPLTSLESTSGAGKLIGLISGL
ncbi:hypothetical protein WG947_16480 [Pontibacter sp. H259]|uniref:hypothetical protein n=1 Tax=Pontibacter sp. H259 TaxID=3133421 RepID=UPI0030BB5CEA